MFIGRVKGGTFSQRIVGEELQGAFKLRRVLLEKRGDALLQLGAGGFQPTLDVAAELIQVVHVQPDESEGEGDATDQGDQQGEFPTKWQAFHEVGCE